MARLVFRADSGETMELTIGPAIPEATVGRHKTCAIITADSTVSRRHAQVRWVDGSYLLEDLGSSNGTFFDGQRVQQHWLEDGDDFACGAFRVHFELDENDRVSTVEPLDNDSDIIEAVEFAPHDYEVPEPRTSAQEIPELLGGRPTDALLDESPWSAAPPPAAAGTDLADAGLLPASSWDQLESEASPAPPAPPQPSDSRRIEPERRDTFSEFNRHLDEKDELIRQLRDDLRVAAEAAERAEDAKSRALQELETRRSSGVSAGEHEALRADHAALQAEAARLDTRVREQDERQMSLEAQIRRVQEAGVSEKEIQRLRDAAAERDQLWEQREALELRILGLRKQLAGGQLQDGDPEELARELGDRLRATQEDLGDALERLKELEAQRLASSQELERIRRESDEQRAAAEQRFERVNDELLRAENRIDELERRPTEETLREAEQTLAHARERAAGIEAELAKALEDGVVTQEERAALAARVNALDTELGDARCDLERTRAASVDRADLERERARAARAESELEAARRVAQAAERERDALNGTLVSVRAELADGARLVASRDREIIELKEIITALPDRDMVAAIERQRDAALRERDAAEAERARIISEGTGLRGRSAELEKELHSTRERMAADLRRAEGERAAVEQRLAASERKARELEDVLVTAPSRTEVEGMSGRISATERERDAAMARADSLDRRGRDLEQQLAAARNGEEALRREVTAQRAALEAKTAGDKAAVGRVAELERAVREAEERRERAEQAAAAVDAHLTQARAAEQNAADRAAEVERRRAALEQELRAAQDARTAAEALAAKHAADSRSVAALTEERNELLAASRSQLKRVTSLQKQLEDAQAARPAAPSPDRIAVLERERTDALAEAERFRAQSAARDGENATAAARIRELEGALERARVGGSALAEAQRTEAELRATVERLEREKASAPPPGAADALRDAQRVEAELRSEISRLEREKAATPPPSSGGGDAAQLSRLIDDLNDRLSALKNNDETIQFCVQDVRNGVDVAGNFSAAMEMLEANGREFDALKESIRRFRRGGI